MSKWTILASIVGILLVAAFFLKGHIGLFGFFHSKPKNNPIPTPGNIIDRTQSFLKDESQNASAFVSQKAQSAVNNLFGNKENKTPQVNVVPQTDQSNSQNIVNIDLSKSMDLKLNFTKNFKYDLMFQNVPDNFCLYLGDNKYQISPNKITEMIFSSTGTFPIKATLCDLNYKNLGEISVN